MAQGLCRDLAERSRQTQPRLGHPREEESLDDGTRSTTSASWSRRCWDLQERLSFWTDYGIQAKREVLGLEQALEASDLDEQHLPDSGAFGRRSQHELRV